MFGYVQIRKPEMKIKDYDIYQGYYCGLCNALMNNYGALGAVTLTYDMTFLVILLSSVYDLKADVKASRCVVHPTKKRKHIITEASNYASHMNIILSYYHFLDDYNDEGSKIAFAGSKVYQLAFNKAVRRYPKKARKIKHYLVELSRLEHEGADIDALADCFGKIMTVLFNYRKDAFSDYLKGLGYHLGRFIYIMDAYDDIEKDKKSGAFNPLINMANVDEKIEPMLYNEMSEAAAFYQKLPCTEYVDILGNILYAGVWNRFDRLKEEQLDERSVQGS